ncbi:MarR family transcriptional regulator [Haloactinopolyspora sp.]|jgi:DNA-binding MarR family transcriptional regulator|uniref:MarR family winged helix-turn-helix transcriptional regulator n=1 Tax=Haloactinopolyspora sp. TaxID=1966353 RepID=UPI0026326B86|nr:MarR family transcriptional regulator [Haloactinopolyspora sp.]
MTKTRWLTTDEQRAWRNYLRMNRVLESALARQLQSDSQLSLPDFEVLVRLTDVENGRLRVSALADALQWEKSRLSHQIARMARRGLVAREECAEDGRGAFVALTPTGRKAIESAAPAHVETVRRLFFDILTDDDIATMNAVSSRVLQRLEDHAAIR